MQIMRPRTSSAPGRWKWTAEEYERLGIAGLIPERGVELIDGEIWQRPPHSPPHEVASMLTLDVLRAAFGSGFFVRHQLSLALGQTSMPEPDLAVVPGSPRDYAVTKPTTALLVVEVSESSLAYDRGEKASLYASAGIADYWVVNVVDRQVEVFRNPVPDAGQLFGFRYADVVVVPPGGVLTPLAVPHAGIAAADLLP